MKILLISANAERRPAPVYPLGVSRLATVLRRAGHEVRVADVLVHGAAGVAGQAADWQPQLLALSLRNIDNTESGNTQEYLPGYLDLVRALRAVCPAPLILGGPGYSI
jgi:hypothetical protein